jgi:hypothetical protein
MGRSRRYDVSPSSMRAVTALRYHVIQFQELCIAA